MNSTIFSWYLFLYLTLKLCEEHIHNNKRMTSGCSQWNNTPFNDVAQISDLSHREMGDIIVSELNFDIPKKKSSSPNVDLRCVSPIYFVLSSEWCFIWHAHHCDMAWSVGLNIFYAWKIRILCKYADLSCIIRAFLRFGGPFSEPLWPKGTLIQWVVLLPLHSQRSSFFYELLDYRCLLQLIPWSFVLHGAYLEKRFWAAQCGTTTGRLVVLKTLKDH